MTGTKPVKLMWDDDIAISSVTLYFQMTKTKQNPTPKQKIAQNKVPATGGKKSPSLTNQGAVIFGCGLGW